jgi:eukaryotic-like serine/threonine-protein kinase
MKVSELSGQIIGDNQYRLLVRLGGGNFGTVYRAEELMNGEAAREVAIKIYKPEATTLGNVEGMLEDCALPARILDSSAPIEQKCHFVPIYSFGKLDTPAGRCAYVSMELVRDGDTLEAIIKRCRRAQRFPREAVIVDLMRQFFTALSLAHRVGVLHRDIKGANVMIQNGLLRVMDFGMGAYANKPETALCTTMSIYAPENFDGRYTEASDIYQAGLMFLELYTGWAPFEERFGGDTDMLRERKKRIDFQFRGGACFEGTDPSTRLDTILSRCLRFSDIARYTSADSVLEALSGTNSADALRQALIDNDFGKAIEIANEILAGPRVTDEQRMECLAALGKSHAETNQNDTAIAFYIAAIKFADETGVYFHRSSKYNELVDSVCILYIKCGQPGMAKLFSKKRKPV